jgi:hypothetical protein
MAAAAVTVAVAVLVAMDIVRWLRIHLRAQTSPILLMSLIG